MFCDAPYYTRNKKFISESVKEPTDFIQLDHSKIDAELTKQGLAHVAFWNVWRLTPSVYFDQETEEWFIKYDYRVFEAENTLHTKPSK